MAQRSHRYNTQSQLKGGGLHDYYVTESAFYFTPQEARAEYARLRREANRRLEVLRRSDFKNIKAVTNRPADYAALPRGASEKEVRRALFDVARFISLKTSSLKGARAARREWVSSMQDAGYTWVNEKNADEFGRFLGAVQESEAASGYDSGDKAGYSGLFRLAKKKNIDPQEMAKDFQYWMQHRQELEKAPKMQSSEPVSSADFKKHVAQQAKKGKRR